MGDQKRSYTNPEFEFEFTKDAAAWNWDLAKRKINKIFNQRAATKEFEASQPKKKRDGILGKHTKGLLDQIDPPPKDDFHR